MKIHSSLFFSKISNEKITVRLMGLEIRYICVLVKRYILRFRNYLWIYMLIKEMCTFCLALPKAVPCHQCSVISWIIVHNLIPQVERARRAIRVFFLIRGLSLLLAMEPETQLPLTNPQICVQVNNVLDLSKLPNTDWNWN